MNIFGKSKRNQNLFVRDSRGNETFNIKLFDKTLKGRSREEIENATSLIKNAVREIGSGKVLSDYDTIALAYISLADALMEIGSLEEMGIMYAQAACLHSRFSSHFQESIDSITGKFASTRLLANVYKKLGPGPLSQVQIDDILGFLRKSASAIENEGEETLLASGEKILILNSLTHDDVSRGYIRLFIHLRNWNEHSKAAFMLKDNLFDFSFYSHLSSSRRKNIKEMLRSLFPEDEPYSVFKEVAEQFDKGLK